MRRTRVSSAPCEHS